MSRVGLKDVGPVWLTNRSFPPTSIPHLEEPTWLLRGKRAWRHDLGVGAIDGLIVMSLDAFVRPEPIDSNGGALDGSSNGKRRVLFELAPTIVSFRKNYSSEGRRGNVA